MMSFEHWNRFIESFKTDQAARGTQRIRAETPTGSSGRGRHPEKAEQVRMGSMNVNSTYFRAFLVNGLRKG